MPRYDDTTQPPPIATSSAVGNAFMASALLTIVALAIMIATDAWKHPLALRLVLIIFAAPLAFAGAYKCRILHRHMGHEFDMLNRRYAQQNNASDIRLIPVQGGRLVDGVDERDLAYFIDEICRTKDLRQRTWAGKDMPSGLSCDNTYLSGLCKPLEKAGYIVGRSERVTGRLISTDARQIKMDLGLTNA